MKNIIFIIVTQLFFSACSKSSLMGSTSEKGEKILYLTPTRLDHSDERIRAHNAAGNTYVDEFEKGK